MLSSEERLLQSRKTNFYFQYFKAKLEPRLIDWCK